MPSLPLRAGICRGLLIALAWMLCALSGGAADAPRAFPLWDGKETVESYAARVAMPATKSIDLGGGVKLDLVLIPAGQFIMGSAEPAKPSATETEAIGLIVFGGSMAAFLALVLLIKCAKQKKFSFSLRWLLLMTISIGLCVGGIARRSLALKEAARYEGELAEFKNLPSNEKPAHLVTIAEPFYMGKCTVTEIQCIWVIGYSLDAMKGDQFPAVGILWDEATEFCKKLNGKLNDKAFEVRLPTEAQWEYACRAGTRTRFYSGENESDLDAVGWHRANSGGTRHPVGQKKPNSFGLYDMHGNVWEWCQDLLNDGSYSGTPSEAPDPPSYYAKHVLRGGDCINEAIDCRSARRAGRYFDDRVSNGGFRVVLNLKP